MENKNFKKLSDFQGKLAQTTITNPAAYSRIQFMKYFKGFNG